MKESGIFIGSEEQYVRESGPQCLQQHQLVINVGTQDTNRRQLLSTERPMFTNGIGLDLLGQAIDVIQLPFTFRPVAPGA